MYAPALSVGEDKFGARWKEGAWLGIKAESGESLIGASEGVVGARDFRRKPENGGRWSKEDFEKFRGVSWEPCSGADDGLSRMQSCPQRDDGDEPLGRVQRKIHRRTEESRRREAGARNREIVRVLGGGG